MTFALPELPYARDALEPHMSRETLEYHYGKHHKAYVDTANKLIVGTEFEDATLEVTVLKSSGTLFNNAAQIWNHDFFWQCLTPEQEDPGKKLNDALVKTFGGIEDFKKSFSETAIGTFGTGWAWLVKKPNGALAVVSTDDAGNPMTAGDTPLLTCDVWEHAYYIDYRNARPAYLEHYWKLVNWAFVEKKFKE